MSIKVLIVDDHELARYATRSLLSTIPELSNVVFEEAENGRDAVGIAQEHKPDIIIMDIAMPEMNGIEATRQIRRVCPKTKIIVLSMHNRRHYLRELLQAGVSGYVLKTKVLHDIPAAVRSVLAGDIYFSNKVSKMMADDYVHIVLGKNEDGNKSLSPRQKEVLQLIVEGKSNKETATILNVTSKAIEATRNRIMHKLRIDNIAELTKYAIQEGLTSLDF